MELFSDLFTYWVDQVFSYLVIQPVLS